MKNEAFFDPEDHTMVVMVNIGDVSIREDDGEVMILLANMTGGIEVVHKDDRIWRSA